MRKYYILLILLLSKVLFAQNLLSNGSFDSDINNWVTINADSTISASWISDDGNTQNGSIEIKDNFNNGSAALYFSDKIPVVAGKQYKFSGFGKVIGSSIARDAGINILFFRADNTITLSTEIAQIFNTQHDTWHFIETIQTAPSDAVYARAAIDVITTSTTSTDYSVARWDDLRFELVTDNPNSFAITPGHSSLWYDPDQNGHGINVYVLADSRILVMWYVFDNQGNPLWLLGLGTHDGIKATLDVSISSGGMFPPNFDTNDVTSDNWGTFELEFSSCNDGLFKWNPVNGNGFTAGEMNIKIIFRTLGLNCSE